MMRIGLAEMVDRANGHGGSPVSSNLEFLIFYAFTAAAIVDSRMVEKAD